MILFFQIKQLSVDQGNSIERITNAYYESSLETNGFALEAEKLKSLGVGENQVTEHIPIQSVSVQDDFTQLPYELRLFLQFCFDGKNFSGLNQERILLSFERSIREHDFVGIDHYCMCLHD